MDNRPINRRPPPLPERKSGPAIPYARPTTKFPDREQRPAMSVLKFFLGLFGGFAVTIFYVLVSARLSTGILIVGLCAKFSLGITPLFYRRWRLFGAGVLTSMALLVMLFGAGIIFGVYLLTQCKPFN